VVPLQPARAARFFSKITSRVGPPGICAGVGPPIIFFGGATLCVGLCGISYWPQYI